MEPTALDIKRTGSLGGERIAMQFDANSIAHIMSVLTDLYSDPAMAVIREYSTNAWDSHIAAGQTRPIEIETPGNMAPFFKVRDFGIGMSVDDIHEIYSKYGASTKRGTNEQVGMLGLGCKSALTFAPQFTLNAVKDGIRATVSISRIEDGSGVMEVVDTRATDEPNGVEVVIPARYNGDFISKVQFFFQFWKEGSVLVNGKPPKSIGGNKVGENYLMVPNLQQDYVVMGNVAYPVKDRTTLYQRDYYSKFGIVAYVPIGSINFTPSREQLHYTTTTNNTLARCRKEFAEGLAAAITNDVENAPSHMEALKKYISWEGMVGRNLPQGVTYKGQTIPKTFPIPGGGFTYSPNAYRSSVSETKQIDYHSFVKAAFITGFTGAKISSDQRAKIRTYGDVVGVAPEFWIVTDAGFGGAWVDKVYSWDDIKKATKSAKKKSSSGLRFKVYDMAKGQFIETDEIDEDTTIVYFSPADYKWCSWNQVATSDEITLVSISKNRWDKFLRDFPEAVTLQKHLRAREAKVIADLTESDRLALGIVKQPSLKSFLQGLDPTKVKDPDLLRYISLVQASNVNSDTIKKWRAMAGVLGEFNMAAKEVTIDSDPIMRYPLIAGNLRVQPHTYIYINAAYEAQKEN